MIKMPQLSVVLPCYNEAKNIPLILKGYSRIAKLLPMELILVDNGSTDDTEGVLKKELLRNGFARSVKVKKNIGYGFGIVSGMKCAKGEFLAFSHADMQCDPYDLYKAWKILSSSKTPEKTMVKGRRAGRSNFFTSCFHATATVLFLRRFDDVNGQPKMFHRSLLEMMKNPPHGFALDFYVQRMALKNGFEVRGFPVKFKKRVHGKSSWATSIRSRVKTIARLGLYLVKLRIIGDR